jgi:RNA polymerase sigma-32 factor
MNGRLAGADRSLNAPLHAGRQDEWQDWLVDERETHEDALAAREDLNRQRSLFAKAWNVLNDRERHIVRVRRLMDEPVTLEDLALQYGISRERVRQVEMRAMQKLQKAVRERAISMAA